jgi:crotonobetainyl-CoA:carnitine CoA-transferase CaiB-like acyl-CoA transferase
VRVLDLSRVVAGPYAAMLLGDLGADVIKVEHPDGDETRRWGPPFRGGTAAYFLAVNRNKRGITADFRDPEDNALVRRLADQAQIVIENFRPGSLANVGLDYETLRMTNPRLVHCTITGFPSDGPHRTRPGFDLVAQAMGGLMSVTGDAGGRPVKVGVPTADLTTAMHATVAVLAALYERDRTGLGRLVEVALIDAQVSALANQAMNWLLGGIDPQRMGSDHPNVAPYRAFQTATGDIVVAVGNDNQFASLCIAIERPTWASDPRFRTNTARLEHRVLLDAELEPLFASAGRDEWLALLDSHDVPCGPVRSVAEVFADPDVTDRLVRSTHSFVMGDVPQVLSPFRFDGQYPVISLPPPGLGEHDAAIREASGTPTNPDTPLDWSEPSREWGKTR